MNYHQLTLCCLALSLSTLCYSQSQAVDPVVIRVQDTASVIDRGTMQDVVVEASGLRNRLNGTTPGAEKIDIANLAKTPALLGERDIMKSIQLLPGVKSEGDGQSGYQVRGGTSSQNLVLLDGAPVYNSGHLMGFFSAFNDDALTGATLYKGGIPARLGGGVSSVFDISTRQGNPVKHKFGVGIGLLSGKAMAEGPISDNITYLVTARRSYYDLFLKATDDYKDTKLNFFDVNAKLNFRLPNSDQFSVSFFKGQDNMGLRDLMSMKWGNTCLSTRWFHSFSDRFFLSSQFAYSNYNSDISTEIFNNEYSMLSYIRQLSLQENFSLRISDLQSLSFGLHTQHIWLKSADWDINYLTQREKRRAWQTNLFVQDDIKIGQYADLSLGLRADIFSSLGGAPYYDIDTDGNITHTYTPTSRQIFHTRVNLEPRASLVFRPTSEQNIKLGYCRTVQHIHAIRNSTSSSMPFDRYTMSSNLVCPMTADQFSLGITQALVSRRFDLSVEGYYKNIRNVYDYKDGKSFMSEIEIERLILGGKGRSYGLETSFHKNTGRLTGWVAYTLSWTENKIDGINNGRWYTASNDRRHDLSIVGMYNLTPSWDLSATWVYNTGQALTAPSAKYEILGETYYYFAERNGYRAPDYHRLDISATHTRQLSPRVSRQLTFGVYNLYARRNPYMILFSDDDDEPSGTKTERVALFGLIPSVSYSIKF